MAAVVKSPEVPAHVTQPEPEPQLQPQPQLQPEQQDTQKVDGDYVQKLTSIFQIELQNEYEVEGFLPGLFGGDLLRPDFFFNEEPSAEGLTRISSVQANVMDAVSSMEIDVDNFAYDMVKNMQESILNMSAQYDMNTDYGVVDSVATSASTLGESAYTSMQDSVGAVGDAVTSSASALGESAYSSVKQSAKSMTNTVSSLSPVREIEENDDGSPEKTLNSRAASLADVGILADAVMDHVSAGAQAVGDAVVDAIADLTNDKSSAAGSVYQTHDLGRPASIADVFGELTDNVTISATAFGELVMNGLALTDPFGLGDIDDIDDVDDDQAGDRDDDSSDGYVGAVQIQGDEVDDLCMPHTLRDYTPHTPDTLHR
jgi:hypothetical protein